MEIDHDMVNGWMNMAEGIKATARTLDIVFVPTSIVRTVMRQEDEHLKAQRGLEQMFEGRYHPKSRARWAVPIMYTAAGAVEIARMVGLVYGACQAVNLFIGQ